jgi:hypothetical protein
MRKQTLLLSAAALICCGMAYGADWITDGGDISRSGWQKNEHTLTKENIKGVHLLWKLSTGETPRALHTLMPPLVLDSAPMPGGAKEMAYFEGVDDDLFAVDPKSGTLVWKRHFGKDAPPARGGGGPQQAQDPAHQGFLNPNGSTGVPVIGPPGPNGVRPLYIVDGENELHSLSTVTGEDLTPPLPFGTNKFGVQLYKNDLIIAGFGGTRGILSTDLTDPSQGLVKTVGFGPSGGLWGRRGPTITSDGTVWTTTGDGDWNNSDPDNLILANSLVGFEKTGGNWKVKDYFTPPNWYWLWKRDLDPNNTPTAFTYKGHELLAASGKECRVYLLDPKNMGGPDHHTPLYKTPLFCNDSADFQNQGSWGAVSSWEDSTGNRYVVVPFWGPASKDLKFPVTNTPAAVDGGVATFKVVENKGKIELAPVWISRNMFRGEPPIIANGMVFSYGSGESTQQAWTDVGLQFDSTIRAEKSGHVVA